MIKWSLIDTVMKTVGADLGFYNSNLTTKQIMAIVKYASLHLTPEIVSQNKILLHSNLQIYIGYELDSKTYQYMFLYSGIDGKLINARILNDKGRWQDLPTQNSSQIFDRPESPLTQIQTSKLKPLANNYNFDDKYASL